MTRLARAIAPALLILFAVACDDDEGTSIDLACKVDSDCAHAEMRCVVPAGVCVGFSNPLEAVDAARPD